MDLWLAGGSIISWRFCCQEIWRSGTCWMWPFNSKILWSDSSMVMRSSQKPWRGWAWATSSSRCWRHGGNTVLCMVILPSCTADKVASTFEQGSLFAHEQSILFADVAMDVSLYQYDTALSMFNNFPLHDYEFVVPAAFVTSQGHRWHYAHPFALAWATRKASSGCCRNAAGARLRPPRPRHGTKT